MTPINTTNGPVEVAERGPSQDRQQMHVVNATRVIEENMVFEDEEPEILAVLPATGWHVELADGTKPPAPLVSPPPRPTSLVGRKKVEGGGDNSYGRM